MGESSGRSLVVTSTLSGKTNRRIVASHQKALQEITVTNAASFSQNRIANGAVGHVAFFLLKVAALETLRRLSKAKCPFAWRGLQALQVFCYPPFKWIQRWTPFKALVKGMQVLSKPLLVVTIATSLSDETEFSSRTSGAAPAYSGQLSEQSSLISTPATGVLDEASQGLSSENWSIQLHRELENQGISLPERFSEDELCRFYAAANGNFDSLLSSIKKTIHWRETYVMLSDSELDDWSHMVFWHGLDLKHRPCLIVRLGHACISLPSRDRPRFAQAVISQVEYGIFHLVSAEEPQITVLVDCEGLSPFKIPMKMMRSCSAILQSHFPNRLASLFVIRLPSVVRVLAQTFVQILKPVTRKKLRIIGDRYERVLSESLETLPSYLGGKCTCVKCSKYKLPNEPQQPGAHGIDKADGGGPDALLLPHQMCGTKTELNESCEQVIRAALRSILMLWLLIAVVAGKYDSERRYFWRP